MPMSDMIQSALRRAAYFATRVPISEFHLEVTHRYVIYICIYKFTVQSDVDAH